jgi:hypothetical protein
MRPRRTILLASFVLVLFTQPWAGAADRMAEVINEGDRMIFQAVDELSEMRLNLSDLDTLEHTRVVTTGHFILRLDDVTDDGAHRYFQARTEEIHPDSVGTHQLAGPLGDTTQPVAVHEPEHQLLPSTPESREIAANVNMTEVQSRLSEKIEELTLSNLAQEQKISHQEETIAALTARLEALEKSTRQSARRSLVAIVGRS